MTSLVLDKCSGSRMFYFDKKDSRVLFGDIRSESHTLCDGRLLEINQDKIMDFRNLPFDDESFNLISFDPPHLKQMGSGAWMRCNNAYLYLEHEQHKEINEELTDCLGIEAVARHKARIEEAFNKLPQYVHAAVKALGKTIKQIDGEVVDVDSKSKREPLTLESNK